MKRRSHTSTGTNSTLPRMGRKVLWGTALCAALMTSALAGTVVSADSVCLLDDGSGQTEMLSDGTCPTGSTIGTPVADPPPTPDPAPDPAPEPDPTVDPDPDPAPPTDPTPTTDPAPTPDPAPTTDPAPTPDPATDPAPTTTPAPTETVTTTTPVAPTTPTPTTGDTPDTSKKPDQGNESSPDDDRKPTQVEEVGPSNQGELARTTDSQDVAPLPKFMDALVFRAQYKPKARIPELPEIAAKDMQTLQSAGSHWGIDWSYLAAIAWLDSRWGDATAPGFVGHRLTDEQWDTYGVDGDGDGKIARDSHADSIETTAKFLGEQVSAKGGGPAIRDYFGGKRGLVKRTHLLASYYRALGPLAVENGLADDAAVAAISKRVLGDERINLYAGGRSDIEAGLIDVRTLVTISFLANRFGQVTISSMVSGHGVFTAGGNVSLHSYGQAVDVAELGGVNIIGNQGRDSVTVKALKDILNLPESMQPFELISLWALGGPSFAAADHADHIHIGWK